MSELTGFIPAGGLGSRLHPHTVDTPKPLLLMGSPDRRIIDWPLEASIDGCSRTWVSTDYLAHQLHDYLDDKPLVTPLKDSRTIGSAGSLIEHYDVMSGADSDGDTLILPSDHIYEDFSVTDFWEHHKDNGADITLLTVSPKPYGEYVSADGNSVGSVEKDRRAGDLSTTGIFILRNKYLMDWLLTAQRAGASHESYNIYHDIICPAVGRAAVVAYSLDSITGYWEDTGTPERYHAANMRVSGGENVISAAARIDPEARLERCVVLGGSVIDSSSVLKDAIISTRQGKIQATFVDAEGE